MHPNPWNIGNPGEPENRLSRTGFQGSGDVNGFSVKRGRRFGGLPFLLVDGAESGKKPRSLKLFPRLTLAVFWIVAAAMDYEDVKGPIAENRFKTMEIFS